MYRTRGRGLSGWGVGREGPRALVAAFQWCVHQLHTDPVPGLQHASMVPSCSQMDTPLPHCLHYPGNHVGLSLFLSGSWPKPSSWQHVQGGSYPLGRKQGDQHFSLPCPSPVSSHRCLWLERCGRDCLHVAGSLSGLLTQAFINH